MKTAARTLTGGGLALLFVAIGCLLASAILPLAAAGGGVLVAAASLIGRSRWGRGWGALLVVAAVAIVAALAVMALSFDVNASL